MGGSCGRDSQGSDRIPLRVALPNKAAAPDGWQNVDRTVGEPSGGCLIDSRIVCGPSRGWPDRFWKRWRTLGRVPDRFQNRLRTLARVPDRFWKRWRTLGRVPDRFQNRLRTLARVPDRFWKRWCRLSGSFPTPFSRAFPRGATPFQDLGWRCPRGAAPLEPDRTPQRTRVGSMTRTVSRRLGFVRDGPFSGSPGCAPAAPRRA